MMKISKEVYFLLIIVVVVSGCKPFSVPSAPATSTPGQPATASPSPSPIPTQAPTSTPLVPALAGTPHFSPSEAINPDNVERLTLLATYGSGYATQLAWSPDGSQVAAATTRGIAIFSAGDLAFKVTLPTPYPLLSLAFSPDGSRLAAGSAGGKIMVWELQSGKVISELQAGYQAVAALVFSQDGSQLSASTGDSLVHLWDTSDWSKDYTLKGHQSAPSLLQFSTDGKTLFSYTLKEQVRRWQLPGGTAGKELYIGIDSLKNSALAGAFSGDGTCFAAAQDNTIRLFDTAKGSTLFLITSFQGRVTAVALNPDCSLLGAVDSNRLTLWDINQPTPAQVLEFPLEIIPGSLGFSPDGSKILLGSPALAVLDIGSQAIVPLSGAGFLSGSALNQVYLPESDTLTRTLVEGSVLQTRLDGGSTGLTLLTGQQWNVSASSLDGEWIAGGGVDGQVSIWNINSPAAARFSFYPDRTRSPSTSLAVDHASQWLAAANAAGKVWVISLADGSTLAELQPGFPASTLGFSSSGNLLLAAGRGQIRVYQAGDGNTWSEISAFKGLLPAFQPDDTILFRSYGEDSFAVTFANPLTGKVVNQLVTPPGELALSGDGTLLAVSGLQLQFYSLPDGNLLYSVDTGSRYAHVFFNRDNSLLTTITWDGVVQLWGIKNE
ncbi:MAG: WD40 repeat domain-containing protein [bacterium]